MFEDVFEEWTERVGESKYRWKHRLFLRAFDQGSDTKRGSRVVINITMIQLTVESRLISR